MFKTCKKARCSTACVVDGKLVLSFPGALIPIVWQMDIAQTKASALEVRAGKKGGEGADKGTDAFILFLKTAKGETVEIAPFATRDDAVDGLMAASRALHNAVGHMRAPANAAEPAAGTALADSRSLSPNEISGRKSWRSALLALVLVMCLIFAWSSLTPAPSASSPGGAGASNQAAALDSASPSAAEPESGVPLSADQYLQGR